MKITFEPPHNFAAIEAFIRADSIDAGADIHHPEYETCIASQMAIIREHNATFVHLRAHHSDNR